MTTLSHLLVTQAHPFCHSHWSHRYRLYFTSAPDRGNGDKHWQTDKILPTLVAGQLATLLKCHTNTIYRFVYGTWNYERAWDESTRAEEIGSRTIVSRNIWHKPDVDRGRSCLHKLRLKTASLSSVVGLRSRRWHALHCSTAGHLSEKEYFRGRYIHFAFSVCL